MRKLPLLINCRYCSIHGAAVIVCTGSHQLNPGRTHTLSFQRDRSLYQHLQEFVLKIVVEFTAVFMWSVTRVALMCNISPCVGSVWIQSAWNAFCVTWFYSVVLRLPSSHLKGPTIHQGAFLFRWKLKLPPSAAVVVKADTKNRWGQKKEN